MTITLTALQKQRRDTAANWTAENPTLLAGEIGIESDTGKIKIGTGAAAWNSLAYQGIIPSSGAYPLSQLIMPLGTAAAPAVTFTGDVNTGIYSPGADQLAISTGGSGRLFVDASGNVGVGGTPNTRFEVTTGAGTEARITSTVDNNADLTFYTNSVQRGIVEGNSLGMLLGTTGALPTTFITNNTERLRITSTGTVNIVGAGSGGSTQAVSFNGSAPVNSLVVDSSGRVGIGTSSPDSGSALDVRGNVYTGNGTVKNIIGNSGGNAIVGTSTTHPLQLYTNGSVALTIDTSQRVGIGTTPDSRLHVSDGSGNALRIGYNPGSNNFNIHDAAQHLFRNNGGASEYGRFDPSGRLLVGTSSAINSQKLQIAGDNNQASFLGFNGSNSNGPMLSFYRSRSSTTGTNTIVQNNDETGSVDFFGADGTNYIRTASITSNVDGTPGANDMPGRIVLSTTLDGTSNPIEALRITNDRVIGYNQAAPVAVDATATLTVANLKNGIITSTTAAAVTGTLPTGTLTEGGFSGLYTNFTFEWTVINTGATNSFTVAAGTDHTVVGNMVVAAGNSGRFATRRTAANTFVTYRLSS